MTVPLKDIIDKLESWAPLDIQARWDNCGLQIGNKDAEIATVLTALEVDKPILDHLNTNPADLVITHHPLFFKGIKQIDYRSDVGQILNYFFKSKAHLYTTHTNLDAATGGVNDCLIEAYGFDPKKGQVMFEGFGKWFQNTPAIELETLLEQHGGELLGNKKKRKINRVAFCGGSGKSFLPYLKELDIDLFITGEMGYHDAVWAEFHDISLLCLGHKTSEQFAIPVMAQFISDAFPSLQVSHR